MPDASGARNAGTGGQASGRASQAQGKILQSVQSIAPPRRTPFIDLLDTGVRAGRKLGLIEPAHLEKDWLLEHAAAEAAGWLDLAAKSSPVLEGLPLTSPAGSRIARLPGVGHRPRPCTTYA